MPIKSFGRYLMLGSYKNNNYDEIFNDTSNYGDLEDAYFDFNNLGNPQEAYPQNIQEEYSYIAINQEDPSDTYERNLAELKIEASQDSTHISPTTEEQGIASTNYHSASNSEHLHSSKLLHTIKKM